MNIDLWMKQYVAAVQEAFGQRVVFIGLQGSRGRNEEREDSDIDVVLILDRLDADDLAAYEALLDALPHRGLICGFAAGYAALAAWEKYDLFQLIHDTTPYVGTLDALLPGITREDVLRAIRVGAGNIYHICVHNRLHGKEPRTLAELYKQAVFVLQAKVWLEKGVYVRRAKELLPMAAGEDAAVLQAAMACRKSAAPSMDLSAGLMDWAAAQLRYASMID